MDWEEISITDLEARVSPEILARGQEYQQSGHILRTCRYERIIAGEVAGTGGAYRIRLVLDDAQISGDCTCPYPGFCKHMAALALAWVEKSVEFIDLAPNLKEVISKPEQSRDLLIQLVRKDPLNYLELISATVPEESFLNSRGTLNLIRNTFRGPSLTHDQIEIRWERVKRIEELVAKAIVKQEKDAPELLRELLKGVADSYRDYPAIPLKNIFLELLSLADKLPQGWAGEEIRSFAETLGEIYLDYSLWELAELVRPALVNLHSKFPAWLLEKMQTIEWGSLEESELILFYELLALVSKNGPAEADCFKNVTEELNKTPEGQLWLIDRITEDDPDRAFALTKEGLRKNSGADKQAFRERLIEIHLKRCENKQAAALSFIQFQEGPNLQEYLRLKEILAGHSGEFHNYSSKLDRVVEEQGLPILAARIAFDRGNWAKLTEELVKIDPDEAFLKELAGLIIADSKVMSFEVFQAIIIRLLLGGRGNWEIVLRVLVCYKKLCLKNSWNEEWGEFRLRLNAEYGEDRRFARKFGAVLAG